MVKKGKNISKSRLAIILSRLEEFNSPKVRAEQYPTDSEIAAEALWNAGLIGDISGKVIADLGCGTGILGLGAIILGARRVFFIDSDESVIETAKKNYNKLKSEGLIDTGKEDKAIFICQDISKFMGEADIVIQNPPFGTKIRHSDRVFLEKAINTAGIVWSFHKSETKEFIEAFCRDNNAKVTHEFKFDFPLKAVHAFHKQAIRRIKVSCFRIIAGLNRNSEA